jgi:hypothetical protein
LTLRAKREKHQNPHTQKKTDDLPEQTEKIFKVKNQYQDNEGKFTLVLIFREILLGFL